MEYLPIYPDSNCFYSADLWKVSVRPPLALRKRGHLHRLGGHRRATIEMISTIITLW